MLMIRHFWFLSTLTLNCMLSSNVKAWAATNCLKLNLSKIKEIVVFKRPRVQYFHMLPAVDDIEQLDCCKLLGVIFQSNFKMDSHIQFIISQCAQRLYLLKLLHHQGLPEARLSVIANAVIIWRLLYALPASGGFLPVELVNWISALFDVCSVLVIFSIVWLLKNLWISPIIICLVLCTPAHALNHLLPPARNCVSLSTRGHSHQLREYSTDLNKKSFLIRCLYIRSFVNWNSFLGGFLLCIVCHSDCFHVYYLMCVCRI